MNALKGVTPATHPLLSATTRTVPTGVLLDKMYDAYGCVAG